MSSSRVINLVCPSTSAKAIKKYNRSRSKSIGKLPLDRIRTLVAKAPFNSAMVDSKCEKLIKKCMAFSGISLVPER
jgi:histone H3/H4